MSKKSYTRETIVSFVKGLDTRARTFTDDQINNVINRGYAELMTQSKRIFSDQDIIPLDDYYDIGEMKVTLDVDVDVTEIYDLYVTIEGDDRLKDRANEVIQGIGIVRHNDLAYRDNRYTGRFHLDLDSTDEVFDNAIVKYYYTPSASDEIVYMDAQTYLAFTDAMWAATNYFLKDIEGEAQKRASMIRTSESITQGPEDIPTSDRAMFGNMGV